MAEERDKPLPSWLRPSTSRAKQTAKHAYPDPRPPKAAPPNADPSQLPSSSSTESIIILSDDDDSDIAIAAHSIVQKDRFGSSQRQAERLIRPARRTSRNSSGDLPSMTENFHSSTENFQNAKRTSTTISARKSSLVPLPQKPGASVTSAHDRVRPNRPSSSLSTRPRAADQHSTSSRSRANTSAAFPGDGSSDNPFVIEDSPPAQTSTRPQPTLATPTLQKPSQIPKPAATSRKAGAGTGIPGLPSAQDGASRIAPPRDRTHPRRTDVPTARDAPVRVSSPHTPTQQLTLGASQPRSHLPSPAPSQVDMTHPSISSRPLQSPSSQSRPHRMAHLPAPSPTVSNSSLPTRCSSPEKDSKQERKGGSFGSHKKKLDPNRTIFGRTLSKELALGEYDSQRVFTSSPKLSREIKPFASAQRPVMTSPAGRQPWHTRASPSVSPIKSGLRNLHSSSLSFGQSVPDSPLSSLVAKRPDPTQERGAPTSRRESASSTLTPKNTVSTVKSQPSPTPYTKTLPLRSGLPTFKPAKTVPKSGSSAKSQADSDSSRAKERAPSETRTHSNTSSASAQSDSLRPKRARLAVGAYTVPGLDASDWPSSKGSMDVQKKRKRTPNAAPIAEESAGVSKASAQQRARSASAAREAPPRRDESVFTLGSPVNSSPPRLKQEDERVVSAVASSPEVPRSGSPLSSPLTDVGSGGERTPIKTAVELSGLQPVHEEAEEEDLAALWGNYDFSAPSPEAVKHEATVHAAAVENRDAARTPSKPAAPNCRLPSPANAACSPEMRGQPASLITPSKRRLSEHGSANGSPQSAVKRRQITKSSKRVAEIVAAREASKQVALENEMRKIEQRLKAAENLSDDEDDDELEDMTTLIDTREPSPVPKPEAVQHEEPLRPVTKMKRVKHVPSKLDKLVDQVRRDQKAGLGDPDALLADFARISPEKEDYTTASESDSSEALPGDVSPHLDSGIIHAALRDLPVDAADKQVLRDVAEPQAVVERSWTGFWTASGRRVIAERRVCPAPALHASRLQDKMLQRAVERADMRAVALCLSRPGLDKTLRDERNVTVLAQWLLDMAFSRPCVDSGLAVLALCKLVSIDHKCVRVFSSTYSLTSILLAVLFRFGMSPIVTDVAELPALPPIALGRDAACELVCAIAGAAAPYAKTAFVHGLDLAWVLLALATDENTSEPLLRAIDHALPPLWILATRIETPIEVAAQLVGAASDLDLPMKAKARMVLRIGCRTEVQRDLARWVAIGLLVPTSIDADKIEAKPKRPDIDLIIAGADTIYTALEANDPDHAAVRAQLVLLTEACSDLHPLIEDSGGKGAAELDHLKELIMRAERKIVHKAFSKDKDYENKTRLGQLHMSLRRIEETLQKRKERARVVKMKSLQAGIGGQLRLSLGQKRE